MSPTSGRQFRLFSLHGFEVRLDLSWLLLALLISWSLGAGVFPSEYPGYSTVVYAWMGIAVAVAVFFSIVFHEFAHSVVARHFGMPIRGITLFIFGGVAEMEREPTGPRAEFLMAIAGPAASFVIAGTFQGLSGLAAGAGAAVPVIGVLDTIALLNVTVAIFNLVPAFPLDGGRVLRALLWHLRKDLRAATRVSSRIGRGFGTALMVLGGISVLAGNPVGGMWWFLIGLFVRGAAAASYQQLVVAEMFTDQPVSRFMRREVVTVAPSLTVADWLEEYVHRQHYKMYPVTDNGELMGVIRIDRLRGLSPSDRERLTVRDLLEPRSAANTIAPDTGTAGLLNEIVRGQRPPRYLVADGTTLLGIISLKDLLELVAVRMDLGDYPG